MTTRQQGSGTGKSTCQSLYMASARSLTVAPVALVVRTSTSMVDLVLFPILCLPFSYHNRVNSKAQLRIPIDGLLKRIPTALHKGILSSRYYAENSSSLVIQADESRKQQANKDTCYRKLNELIMDVYKHTVPGETTEDQKERVRKLQKAANEARLKGKHIHSSKKQSRSRNDE